MKKLTTYVLISIFSLVALQSCYKDKGNYSYNDINEITISSAASSYNVMVPDSLKIDITLHQTQPHPDGLTFQWVLYPSTAAPLTRRTIGTTQNLRAAITEDPGPYVLDFFVKDKKTGVEFQKKFAVNVLTALSEGWIVVEEKNNACDLHLISPTDAIFKDVYSLGNGGQKLPAGTFRIPDIKTNRNIQSIYILSPSDMVYVNFANFLKVSSFNDFFFEAPPLRKPQEYFLNGDQEAMLNNGKPYGRNLNGPGSIKLNLPPVGNYYMAPFEIYSIPTNYIWYDTIGQRFYRQDAGNFNLLTFPSDPSDPFDMNNIGKRLLYVEVNTVGATFQYFAFFKNNNDDSLFAYNFKNTAPRPPVAVYSGLNAPGMQTAKYFVMSRSLPYLYYASGNNIYKLDILAKTAAPIYTFPAGTEIRAMKMYRNMKTSADPNNNKRIAVATLEGGTQGKVYYFQISATGAFENNTYSKLFDGFGKINEITYKSLK
ncbi:MAG TPA: PKD-like family lipoprotein [Chitinophagaceae bacterium]